VLLDELKAAAGDEDFEVAATVAAKLRAAVAAG
jgi:hypothetical protein